MYLPDSFREDRTEVLHSLIRAHPFATLVINHGGALAADHVPLLFDPRPDPHGALLGHLAAANPLCRTGADEIAALVIFQGAQSYVSPTWYASKAEHGKVVPTWNYAVVHVEGRLQFHRDPAWLHAQVSALTERHESERQTPWAVTDAPGEFVERQLRGIVGIEIAIDSIAGKWKVSQNRPPADRKGVIAGLGQSDTTEAQEMARLVGERDR